VLADLGTLDSGRNGTLGGVDLGLAPPSANSPENRLTV
jgi:hypothetical protein